MIILENNLMRLKFYPGGFPKKCDYIIYDSSSNISYLTYLSKYVSSGVPTYVNTKRLIEDALDMKSDLDDILMSNLIGLNYMKNLSFSIMDEDLLCEPVRIFIDESGKIFLGRVDGMDSYVINSITYFVMIYLSGVHLSICNALISLGIALGSRIETLMIDLVGRNISFSYYTRRNRVVTKEMDKDSLGKLLYIGSNISYKSYVKLVNPPI